MTTKTQHDVNDLARRLAQFGITRDDTEALRRIAMTLDRWHELECGDGNGNAIERDEATGKPYWTYDIGRACGGLTRGRTAIADRERGALRQLDAIMARYPNLRAYVQGDPRGLPLYVLPPGVSEDCYHSGVGVGK